MHVWIMISLTTKLTGFATAMKMKWEWQSSNQVSQDMRYLLSQRCVSKSIIIIIASNVCMYRLVIKIIKGSMTVPPELPLPIPPIKWLLWLFVVTFLNMVVVWAPQDNQKSLLLKILLLKSTVTTIKHLLQCPQTLFLSVGFGHKITPSIQLLLRV